MAAHNWPSDYHGHSGSLSELTNGWTKRLDGDASMYQPAYDNDATDVVGLAIDGMKMSLHLLDTSVHRSILAVLYPATRQLFLDWTLVPNAPAGLAMQSTFVWRRAVDSSLVARFLVAWAIAHLTTDTNPCPYVYGFCPPEYKVSPKVVSRQLVTMHRVAQLLAPRPRLYGQLRELTNSYPNPNQKEPDWLVPTLAERNHCPTCIVDVTLDSHVHTMSWQEFTSRLLAEMPMLRFRHHQSAKLYLATQEREQAVRLIL